MGNHHHDHGDHSGHGHHQHGSHGHLGHSHAPADFGRAFAIGTLLNIGFVLVEGAAGFWFDSMALLADAGHNLSDVLGLLIAWGGVELAKRPASRRFTYGLGASTILAALANALVLLIAVGAILLETIQRLGSPRPIDGWPVVWVALAGIVVNLATALLFARGRHGDVNIRGAYLHMAADAAVSAGVVIAGLAILWTGAGWIDPVVSLAVVAIILIGTWSLLSESLLLALQAVPRGIDAAAVEALLAGLPGVARVHDLHIWPMSTTETALTAHLVMPDGHPGDAFLTDLSERLEQAFGIGHATVQVETGDDCALTHAH
ncbi:cobalt transporter [Sphingomonas sp. Leaf24]|uniref:cation diffusion facilitator family transporter n=1 Tax=unclassified Sphingomonas TaxID=196159 RepID=UPI0006FA9870|nr:MULTISPECIES: cation diffusion facilitator family transporter [unclassified Sphingomonas]KQM20980.1 cobalt transporter [Sphingomonas sp. Leaf5]KQM93132.1 cobalt transporter [Sphingomonas sp. Leaf22]KQM93381.1 cobalt transporter [Sphingomonas sp. Leaf24]